MNLLFRDECSKSNYFHIFALVTKFRYKYCTSNISYELSDVKVLT